MFKDFGTYYYLILCTTIVSKEKWRKIVTMRIIVLKNIYIVLILM